MPELPEVETIRRGLESALIGQTIKRVDLRRPNLRWALPLDLVQRLTDARIDTLRRRSKYILADLDTGDTLIVHLGMSGRVLLHQAHDSGGVFEVPPLQKHDHVVIDLRSGTRIVYNDPRRFGMIDICRTEALDQHRLLQNIGPEPLGNSFDDRYLQRVFKGRNMPAKSALLDQKLIAGLGNIYVCESLWHAGISPLRRAGSISPRRLSRLVVAIREILGNAIASGGSTLRDYRTITGEVGGFQDRFAVYDREGKPCQTPDCKGTIVRITQSGRSTYFCRRCQR